MILLMLAIRLALPCEPPDVPMSRAESDTASYFLADALRALDDVVASLGCSPAADTRLVARFWTTHGVLRRLQGDEAQAARSMRAALAADPSWWLADFGDEARQWRDALPSDAPQTATAQLSLRGVTDADWVRVDGQRWAVDQPLVPGPHLIQVGSADTARFAKQVDLVAEGPTLIVVPALAPRLADASDPQPIAQSKTTLSTKNRSNRPGRTALYATGGALAATGAALLGASLVQRASLRDGLGDGSVSMPEAEASATSINRQVYLGYTAVGIGVAAGLAGHLAFSARASSQDVQLGIQGAW